MDAQRSAAGEEGLAGGREGDGDDCELPAVRGAADGGVQGAGRDLVAVADAEEADGGAE